MKIKEEQIKQIKIVCISDTHNNHLKLKPLPEGDILIHAGDYTFFSDIAHASDFNKWLGTLNFKHKIIVNGNHEYNAEWQDMAKKEIITNGTFLNQEGITVEGLKIFGINFDWPGKNELALTCLKSSSYISQFICFENLMKDTQIPIDTDILVSHNPAKGYVDNGAGCKSLLAVIQKIKPKLVVCGHIHEAHGIMKGKKEDGLENTLFVNAAVCLKYSLKFDPIVIEI